MRRANARFSKGVLHNDPNLDSDQLQTLPGSRLPKGAAAIEELYDWSLNFRPDMPNPFQLFCDITEHSVDRYGMHFYRHEVKYSGEIWGFMELTLLGKALLVFEENGWNRVYEWIDILIDAETDED